MYMYDSGFHLGWVGFCCHSPSLGMCLPICTQRYPFISPPGSLKSFQIQSCPPLDKFLNEGPYMWMYMYMYVHIHVCMYMYVCMYVYTCMYIFYMCICYTCMYVCTYLCTCMNVYYNNNTIMRKTKTIGCVREIFFLSVIDLGWEIIFGIHVFFFLS